MLSFALIVIPFITIIIIFASVSTTKAKNIELYKEFESEPQMEGLAIKCHQRMETWEERLKKVEENFKKQMDDLKSKMAKAEARTLQRVEDDEQDGEGVRHHLMHKRESKKSSKFLLPFCTNSSMPCSFFYHDRPDMKKPIMVGKNFCTFYHPDHPDSKVVSLKPVETITNSSNASLSSGIISEHSGKKETKNPNLKDSKNFPPASCDELQMIGYTLNGFYLVNGEGQSNINGFEIVLCRFEEAQGSTYAKEERFSLFAMDTLKSITTPISNSPISLMSSQNSFGSDAPTTSSSSPNAVEKFKNEMSTLLESPPFFTSKMNSMNIVTSKMPILYFDSSSSTDLIKKGKQSVSCIPLWQLKIGEPLNCLTVEHVKITATKFSMDRPVLEKCDNRRPSEQKWSMIETENCGMRICQDGMDQCLTYDPEGILGPTVSLKKHDEEAKTQLFKMNIETSQLVIVETGSCLMGAFRSYPYVPGVKVVGCDENTDSITYKKWYIVPLKNCL